VVPLGDVWIVLRRTISEWELLRLGDLRFGQWHLAILTFAVVASATLIVLLARRLRRRARGQLTVPAVLPVMRWSSRSALRHLPFALFLAGLPFFAVALADPYTAFAREEVAHPGRRIALMIDASASMSAPFASLTLQKQGAQVFFTTVAAAEYFLKLRLKGPYRDVIALIEFGNEAYVVTPFTTDYENLLLSMRLIGDPNEWQRFPDQGTIIMQAINRGTQLFKSFDFLNASGNLMVIFSDGEDSQVKLEGRPIDDVLAEARKHEIPVYMIRTAFNKSLGGVVPDEIWKWAVERTGGRFYPAADESTIIRAVEEIDRLSAGRVILRDYTAQRPRFAGYTLAAVALWSAATMMKIGFSCFRTFP
jgi:von Willebrand factor type A domain